jgi:hypothetical protein
MSRGDVSPRASTNTNELEAGAGSTRRESVVPESCGSTRTRSSCRDSVERLRASWFGREAAFARSRAFDRQLETPQGRLSATPARGCAARSTSYDWRQPPALPPASPAASRATGHSECRFSGPAPLRLERTMSRSNRFSSPFDPTRRIRARISARPLVFRGLTPFVGVVGDSDSGPRHRQPFRGFAFAGHRALPPHRRGSVCLRSGEFAQSSCPSPHEVLAYTSHAAESRSRVGPSRKAPAATCLKQNNGRRDCSKSVCAHGAGPRPRASCRGPDSKRIAQTAGRLAGHGASRAAYSTLP